MTKLEIAARQIIVDWDSGIHLYEAITALREALAEQAEQRIPSHVHIIKQMEIIPEHEPVAKVDDTAPGFINWTTWKLPEQGTPLYAAPVRTKDLTDDEIEAIVNSVGAYEVGYWQHAFARAVIADDREKNK